MIAGASTRASRAIPRISSILIATAALLAAPSASATKLIARYTFFETSGPNRNDSVGINTVAMESGLAGYVYDAAPVPAGAYGELTVGNTQLGAAGGLDASGNGTWATTGNTEFGALTNDFTVMAWVKITSTDTGATQRIFGRTFPAGAGGWSFGVADGGRLLLTGLGIVDVVSTNTAVIQGEWTHVAATKSSTTGVTFFVNGTQFENQPTQTGPWDPSADSWHIGSLGLTERMVGLLDDLRVYDGALDAKGIREALEASGTPVPNYTLMANYTFGEAAGPKRYDFAGTPTDATGIGGSLFYGLEPIPAGTYGSVTIAGNTFGANGGTSTGGSEWLTPANNELGALTNDFTVMAWARADLGAGRERIIGRNGPGTGGWGFGIDAGGATAAYIFTGYGVVDAGSASAPIVQNTWQHLAATKSGTAGVSFYLNGNLVERLAGLTAPWLPSPDAWSLFGGTESFAGDVDEVRVYQGVLDTQSIRDAAAGFICSNPNLALGTNNNIPSDDLVLTDEDLIEDLNVTVDLSYARVGDMNLTLKHLETGIKINMLVTPVNGGGTCNGRDLQVTLDDSAPTFADAQCAATRPTIKGTFKPSQPLAAFHDKPLAGTWRLAIEDAEGPGVGNLFRWCLQAQKSSIQNRIFIDAFETP